MEVAHEGVTAPIGFQAAGVNCGIKKLRKDVALVVSDDARGDRRHVHDQQRRGGAGGRRSRADGRRRR